MSRILRVTNTIRAVALLLFLIPTGPFAATQAEAASTFYVNPQGRDAWSGTLAAPNAEGTDGPKASLAGARDAVLALKAKGPLSEMIHVKIAGGLYVLTEPVIFTPGDSGTAEFPVVYEAMPGERPLFSGGKAITGFHVGVGGLWQVRIPEVSDGNWYFEQLFVNGQRAVRARYPNLTVEPWLDVRTSRSRIRENLDHSFYTMQAVSEEIDDSGKVTHKIDAAPGTLDLLASSTPAQLKDTLVIVHHGWNVTQRFIRSLDIDSNSLTVPGTKWTPWNPWKPSGFFHLENFKAALDAPGEWFLDRDGTLFYKPLPGQDPDTIAVVAPRLDALLVFKGEPKDGQYVENLQFKGLSFQHSQWLTPAGGVNPSQAASITDAAIMADELRNAIVSDCEIAHVGKFGIWFRRGCENVRLEHCLIHDTGAGGVRIGETKGSTGVNEPSGKITIDNNIIRSGGRICPESVAVLVGQSGDNTISHNDIADHYYTGISTGWTWGYTANPAKNNRVEYNHIHHLGQGVLSDLAGFYSLGPSDGTSVTGNVVHDVYSTTYGGWGLYTDEGSTGVTLRNNLVYNTKTGGFHQHFGRDNVVSNNIFAFSLQWQVQLTRPEEHRSFTFSNNIVYWTQGGLYAGPFDKAQVLMEKNLFWNAHDSSVNFTPVGLQWQGKDIDATIAALAKLPKTTLQQWQEKGRDIGSTVEDPHFVDPLHYDFRLRDDVPAARIGFVPFDYSKAGVYGEDSWKKQATAP